MKWTPTGRTPLRRHKSEIQHRIFGHISHEKPDSFRVASRRTFADAKFLRDSNDATHAVSAMYLAGFVVECLLKAELLTLNRFLATPQLKKDVSDSDIALRNLYRSHRLGDLLAAMPSVESRLKARSHVGHEGAALRSFKVVETWTILARYSTKHATLAELDEFLGHVQAVVNGILV